MLDALLDAHALALQAAAKAAAEAREAEAGADGAEQLRRAADALEAVDPVQHLVDRARFGECAVTGVRVAARAGPRALRRRWGAFYTRELYVRSVPVPSGSL